MCTHFLSHFSIVLDRHLPFVVFLNCVSLMDSTRTSRIEESSGGSQCQSGISRRNDEEANEKANSSRRNDKDSSTANRCSTSNTVTSSSFSNTANTCINRNTASRRSDSHKGDTQAPKGSIKNPVSFSRSSRDRDSIDSSNSSISEQSDLDASLSDSDSDSQAERQESRCRSRPMVRTGARSRESAESSAERPRKWARTELE